MSTMEKAKHTPAPWPVDPDRFWIRAEVAEQLVRNPDSAIRKAKGEL